MKKIAWVTDSTANVDNELQQHPDVYTIPLTLLLDDEEYLEGIDLTPHQLFEKLEQVKTIPKTSQPSIGTFKEFYESLASDYDVIISVHLSSKLSGTYQTSKQAAALVDIPVYSIDTNLIAFPMTILIKQGIKWAQSGDEAEDVCLKIKELTKRNETYVLVGSLEQLHRSGRMSGLQFMLGSVLNIKPIISIEDGELKMKDKVRSEKRAKQRIVSYLQKTVKQSQVREVYLLYGLHEEAALSWKQELEELLPDLTFVCHPLSAAIGLHAGEHTLGISWYSDLE